MTLLTAASSLASHVDGSFRLAFAVGLVGVGAFVVALLVSLGRPRGETTPPRARSVVAVAAAPLALAVGLFAFGFHDYVDAAVAPADAIEVVATASKWQWSYEYANGRISDKLEVPRDRPVHLTLRSRDVVHRFAVPALRVEAEARPDEESSLWFHAQHAGQLPLLCGEECGGGHEAMGGAVEVVDGSDFDDWLEGDAKLTPVQLGQKLYVKSTCVTCHSTDGKPGTGPSFKGLFGRNETLADGTTVKVDEAYIRESVLEPTAKVVRGFQPVMPPFKGQLDDKQIDALIAFIKDVKP